MTNANPSFSTSQLNYQDIDSIATAITENDQQIVQNQSNLHISFLSATSQKYSSISGFYVIFNGLMTSYLSSGAKNIRILNSFQNLTFQVKIIDSRGNYITISKNIIFLVWQAPNINYQI
jgi:hypothetical protein